MRRFGRNVIVACLSVVVAALVLEVVFRVLDIRGVHESRTREWDSALVPRSELPPGIHIQFKPYSRFEFNYDSNPRGYFNEKNGLAYHMNNYGFRGPDYQLAKPSGTRRVMLLGDSFTFGEGVKLEHTLSSQLQTLLQHRIAPNIEVLNFGVSAWGTAAEISYLEQTGVRFDPDLVVVVYVLNDASHAGGLDLWDEFRSTYERRALSGSYLVSYLYAVVAREVYGRRYVRDLVDSALKDADKWERSFSYLQRGDALADAEGFEYVVAIFPFMFELDDDYPFLPLHRKVADFCVAHEIRVVDLLPAFAGESYTNLWVHPSDQHPNERAHRIAAEALAEYITHNALLNDDT